MKKISCHCGKVKLQIKVEDLGRLQRCNCSICKRKGAVMSMIKNEDFKISRSNTHG